MEENFDVVEAQGEGAEAEGRGQSRRLERSSACC